MAANEIELDPDYWWIRLSNAMRSGDLEDAAEAQRRLATLGVDVRFRSIRPTSDSRVEVQHV